MRDILASMDMELHDARRSFVGRAAVDALARPVRVRVAHRGQEHDVFLQWDGAVDDAGQLRTCIACSCPHLYRQRTLPQFTPFVLVLAAAGFVIGMLGYSSNPIVLAALIALLVLDVAALIFARTVLVCYRCRSRYGRTRVARYIARWNPRTAALPECMLAEQAAPRETPTTSSTPEAAEPRNEMTKSLPSEP
jgi:hypothetical protein